MLTLCSPMLALEMLSPIAVTETAEVGTGWGRGGEGVGTGESAAGAAPLYNLRLPPKASGKDTGEWPSPGFKGYPEAGKIVNLHFPWIYIFAKIYISNLRKLKGKCKFYIFLKNLVFR